MFSASDTVHVCRFAFGWHLLRPWATLAHSEHAAGALQGSFNLFWPAVRLPLLSPSAGTIRATRGLCTKYNVDMTSIDAVVSAATLETDGQGRFFTHYQ